MFHAWYILQTAITNQFENVGQTTEKHILRWSFTEVIEYHTRNMWHIEFLEYTPTEIRYALSVYQIVQTKHSFDIQIFGIDGMNLKNNTRMGS